MVGERSLGLTDCRAATLNFFNEVRGQGEDSDRGETELSPGVTLNFTAYTLHAEEKQECLRRHSKCEQEILSGSFGPYTTGFSQTSLFIPKPFSSGTNSAQWHQEESKFLLRIL